MEHLGQFIINHWQLWLVLLVILLLTFLNEFLSQKKQAKQITPQAAVNLINNKNALVIDLRDSETFKSGHIVDSINALDEDFEQHKMDKYKAELLILVCTRGVHTQSLANKIRTLGFQALVLSGGITAWKNADLPLIKGK